MRQKSNSNALSSEEMVKGIRRATRKRYSAEEKIRIVLDGLRGEDATNRADPSASSSGGAVPQLLADLIDPLECGVFLRTTVGSSVDHVPVVPVVDTWFSSMRCIDSINGQP